MQPGDQQPGGGRAVCRCKLPEVPAATERAEAMRVWLEAARDCDCGSPEDGRLFPQPEEAASGLPLHVTHSSGCRRTPR
jgi:hypothetical protein